MSEIPGDTGERLIRSFAEVEIRATGDGRTLCGIACPFGRMAEIRDAGGSYNEVIHRGAFARTIAERGPERVKVLSQHDGRSNPIGRASLLREDPAGLYAEMRISKTQAGDEALELIRDGALDGLSIGFTPVTSDHDHARNLVHRHEVKLHEISTVTWPAYETARVAHVRWQPGDLADLIQLDLERRRAQLAITLSGAKVHV
jgi:HK97 family phage prohead protease